MAGILDQFDLGTQDYAYSPGARYALRSPMTRLMQLAASSAPAPTPATQMPSRVDSVPQALLAAGGDAGSSFQQAAQQAYQDAKQLVDGGGYSFDVGEDPAAVINGYAIKNLVDKYGTSYVSDHMGEIAQAIPGLNTSAAYQQVSNLGDLSKREAYRDSPFEQFLGQAIPLAIAAGGAYVGAGASGLLGDAGAAAGATAGDVGAAGAAGSEAASSGGFIQTGGAGAEALTGGAMPAGVTAGGGVEAINAAAPGSITKGLSEQAIMDLGLGGAAGAGAASLLNPTTAATTAGTTTAATAAQNAGGGTVGDETFLDNWDMQPDPYNTYQDPSVIDMGGGGLDLSSLSGPLKSLLTSSTGRALLGIGAGGLLGGLGSNSKPSGTTTTVQDIPDWLKPFVMGNMNAATGVRDSLTSGTNVVNAAVPGYLKTINGDYLSPGSNPYLDATYNHAAGLVGAGVDSRFESAGRYGSGAHQGVLQEGMNNLATSIYGGNYQTERARQDAATTGAPQFATNQATAGYAPYTGYASLFPNVRSTTAPYFNNTGAGILGGALAGGSISRMFG